MMTLVLVMLRIIFLSKSKPTMPFNIYTRICKRIIIVFLNKFMLFIVYDTISVVEYLEAPHAHNLYKQ